VLLYGPSIRPANNVNVSYFDDPEVNRRLRRAAALVGPARLRAYGQIDVDVMRNQAPIAPILNANQRYLVSDRLGCFTYQPVLGAPDLAALCLR
jgi:hypothetical protein